MEFLIILILTVFGIQSCCCNEHYIARRLKTDFSARNSISSVKYLKNLPINLKNSDNFSVKKKDGDFIFDQDNLSKLEDASDRSGRILPLNSESGCNGVFSKCEQDSDCCCKFCDSMLGRCIFNPFHHESKPKCRQIKQQCLFNYQCCSELCDPVTGMCQEHMVTLHPPVSMTTLRACSPHKGTCQVDAHCCSQVCDSMKGVCLQAAGKSGKPSVMDFPNLLNVSIVSSSQA